MNFDEAAGNMSHVGAPLADRCVPGGTDKPEGLMHLSEITSPDTRLFAKSEVRPVSDAWPALSFSSHKIATDFANTFRRGRDFVLYVGTGDPEKTENPAHRQRLMSFASVEPRAPIGTRDLVPAESWERATRKWGIRWVDLLRKSGEFPVS